MNLNRQTQSVSNRFDVLRPTSLRQRIGHKIRHVWANKRLVRYVLISLNVLMFVLIVWFTFGPTYRGQPLGQEGVLGSGDQAATEPLDVLSSADIATTVATATGLYETTAVMNQAISETAEQASAPADAVAISKPQTAATPFKSVKDIVEYVVQSGDSVSSVASRFGVTSDSIMWSNGLRSNSINAGIKLLIPPVNGIVYNVRAGDTVDNLAQKYRASTAEIVTFNDIELTGLKVGERILIPGGQQPAPVIISRSIQGVFGYNGYDLGFCTWYVANRRAQAGNPVPANLGNASSWDDRARAIGMSVNKSPGVGAAVVTSQRGAGHVAYVEAINEDGSIWISEMNSSGQVSMNDSRAAGGWGKVDWKLIPAGTAGGYNYIH